MRIKDWVTCLGDIWVPHCMRDVIQDMGSEHGGSYVTLCTHSV